MTFEEWYETLNYKYTPLIKELMRKTWKVAEEQLVQVLAGNKV